MEKQRRNGQSPADPWARGQFGLSQIRSHGLWCPVNGNKHKINSCLFNCGDAHSSPWQGRAGPRVVAEATQGGHRAPLFAEIPNAPFPGSPVEFLSEIAQNWEILPTSQITPAQGWSFTDVQLEEQWALGWIAPHRFNSNSAHRQITTDSNRNWRSKDSNSSLRRDFSPSKSAPWLSWRT